MTAMEMGTENNTQEQVSDEIVDLVVARLETIPQNIAISIGDEGSFNIQELIDRVRARDPIGKKMIKMQLEYIRSLKNFTKDDSHHETALR